MLDLSLSMPDFSVPGLAPMLLLALAAFFIARPGARPGHMPLLAEIAALLALLLGLAGLAQLWLGGERQFTLAGMPIFRLDAISVSFVTLVAFIGWIVLRYARRYLDGEAREGAFHGLTLAAIAAVLALVQAANLVVMAEAFIVTGLAMRHLLLFYPGRPEARRAAAKFSLVWGAGDLALILAALLLWIAFGTLDFAGLAARSSESGTLLVQVALALLVLAALLKTAAFPVHGWLTEVMEAPTPVSALLHAGIINSGGVLLISLAPLVQQSPGAMASLVLLGGFTALFGGVVMLTQSATKTALAWSSVAQMGFMLLQCGLGLWPLALLHIVAHSLYKAHAFLSAGEAISHVNAIRKPGPVAVPGLGAVARAFALALALYGAVALGFWMIAGPKSAQAVALGAILIFGISYLIAQGLADAAPGALTRRTLIASLAATLAYFCFQFVAQSVWGAAFPDPLMPGPLEWALIVLAILSFGLMAVAQALFPLWAHHPATAGLRVHLANGLYLNAVLDRMIGGFRALR